MSMPKVLFLIMLFSIGLNGGDAFSSSDSEKKWDDLLACPQ